MPFLSQVSGTGTDVLEKRGLCNSDPSIGSMAKIPRPSIANDWIEVFRIKKVGCYSSFVSKLQFLDAEALKR